MPRQGCEDSEATFIAYARFIVKGDGPFPFDMLWYDSCIPDSPYDAAKLSEDGERSIVLKGPHPPTFLRWAQRSWSVIGVNI